MLFKGVMLAMKRRKKKISDLDNSLGGITLCDENENVVGNTEKQRRFYQLNGIVIEDFFPFWRERIPQRIRRRKKNESRPPVKVIYSKFYRHMIKLWHTKGVSTNQIKHFNLSNEKSKNI